MPPHHDHGVLLGTLIGQGQHILYRLGIIDDRLSKGEERFAHHDHRLGRLEASKSREDVPRWERHAKRWAALLMPAVTLLASLWATGSIEAGARFLAALK